MGEGTDLAETSPFSEEQVEELRCSTHPAALCRGEPAGKMAAKEALPRVRGCPDMESCYMDCWAMQAIFCWRTPPFSPGGTTGVTIKQAGQWHTEAELLSGCFTLFMVYRGFQCPPGLLQAKRITQHRNRQAQATRALKTREYPSPSKFHSGGWLFRSIHGQQNKCCICVTFGKMCQKDRHKAKQLAKWTSLAI